METGDNKKKKYKRMYDSKYKIPTVKKSAAEFSRSVTVKNAAASQQAAKEAKLQDKLIIFKRVTNSFTTLLMGLSSIAMILLYIYLFIKL
jgi:hypothetical protein